MSNSFSFTDIESMSRDVFVQYVDDIINDSINTVVQETIMESTRESEVSLDPIQEDQIIQDSSIEEQPIDDKKIVKNPLKMEDKQNKTLIIWNDIRLPRGIEVSTDEYDFKLLNRSFPRKSKWENVLSVLKEVSIEDYTNIWIPDANLELTNSNIKSFLSVVYNKHLYICQPSIIRDIRDKSFIHQCLLHDPNNTSTIRQTQFIECKMPCFKTEFVVENLIKFLDENVKMLKSGWGMDIWWSSTFKDELYVVDSVKVKNNKNIANNTIGMRELKYFVNKYDIQLNK